MRRVAAVSHATCAFNGCNQPRCRKNRPYCVLHRGRRRPTEDLYEEKVDRSGGPDACHPWRASRNRLGYGLFGHDGETLAIRWAYKQLVGPLTDDEVVRHTCDNPPCQNRRHWRVGAQVDNILDMVTRGRQNRPRGERNVKAKLTVAQVAEIRTKPAGVRGWRLALAREYGVSAGTIYNIRTGRTWL